MKITKGIVKKPFFMVLYGPAKVGKTTFVSGFQDAIIIGPEDGSDNIDVARMEPAKTFEGVQKQIDWLLKEKHDYKTVGLDSITKLELLLFEQICAIDKSKHIDAAQGGYGKGRVLAYKMWQELVNSLFEVRRERGMNIVAIGHSKTKKDNNPLLPEAYDKLGMDMDEKAVAVWTREADVLALANVEMFLKTGDNEKQNRVFTAGDRKLYTSASAGFEAGNRYGIKDPLPLYADAFLAAIKGGVVPETADQIRADMVPLWETLDVQMKETVGKYIAECGNDIDKLTKCRTRLKEMLNKQ